MFSSNQNISDEHLGGQASRSEYSEIFDQLQEILEDYLSKNSRLTINSVSQKCAISEPTLRRIRKGQLKTVPSVSTIFELLSFIFKEKDAEKIIEVVGGPLGDYLLSKSEQVMAFKNLEFSQKLTDSLKNPTKYLIYKMAASSSGVEKSKVLEIFGSYGLIKLEELVHEELIFEKDAKFHGCIENFALSHSVFVENFKTLAESIKPDKHATATKSLSPLFTNYSNSITKEAYSEILKVQRAANKKIARILNQEKSQGSIQTFVINAVDTIDNLSADELVSKNLID